MFHFMSHLLKLTTLLLALAFMPLAHAKTTETVYDIALIGGRVIDPETGLDAIRNVGMQGNTIAVITAEAINAKRIIDVRGLVVSPGFIDMHAHGQSILSGRVQAFDGVTTALELESGTYPVADFYTTRAAEGRPINYGASVNWLGTRLAAVLDMEPKGNADWFAAAMNRQGWQNSIATPDQLAEIEARVAEALDEGGLGVGFLTGYAPGSGYKEYYAVSKLAAARKAPTFTHARYLSMAEPESSFEAMQEIVAVAASTGVQAHIVHMNSISLKDIRLIGEMIRGAQERGAKIS
ncbi:MAG TPA: amidohydrolase family protein, partial [Pseudidiomarina sp.]|nr:amidohydrolase family protein [Pseudidiomarina sp.]